jgi:hypothetical protein
VFDFARPCSSLAPESVTTAAVLLLQTLLLQRCCQAGMQHAVLCFGCDHTHTCTYPPFLSDCSAAFWFVSQIVLLLSAVHHNVHAGLLMHACHCTVMHAGFDEAFLAGGCCRSPVRRGNLRSFPRACTVSLLADVALICFCALALCLVVLTAHTCSRR